MVSKLIPPLNSNHRQVIFYSPDTITTYVRDSINLKCIKVVEGDIGLTFLEFQMVMGRVAVEFAR